MFSGGLKCPQRAPTTPQAAASALHFNRPASPCRCAHIANSRARYRAPAAAPRSSARAISAGVATAGDGRDGRCRNRCCRRRRWRSHPPPVAGLTPSRARSLPSGAAPGTHRSSRKGREAHRPLRLAAMQGVNYLGAPAYLIVAAQEGLVERISGFFVASASRASRVPSQGCQRPQAARDIQTGSNRLNNFLQKCARILPSHEHRNIRLPIPSD